MTKILKNALIDYLKGLFMLTCFSPVIALTLGLLGILAKAFVFAAKFGYNLF
jgi:hypothetical protein